MIAFVVISHNTALAQSRYSLKVETGFLYDKNNSFGPRLKIEIPFQLNKHWAFGVAFDTKWHLLYPITDHYDFPANANSLTCNAYYCLNPDGKSVHFVAGAGLGGIYLHYADSHQFGLKGNVNMTVNFRISEKLTFYTAPLFFFAPLSEFNMSTIQNEQQQNYWSFSVFPLGWIMKF